jgi:alginate O-acetyltransferase complex protein AlgI
MLFNSFEYILIFLPIAFIGYFVLLRLTTSRVAQAFLVLASFAFYSWWGWRALPIIVTSIVINYFIGSTLGNMAIVHVAKRKAMLTIGVALNLLLLGYFKYANFFIENVNSVSNVGWAAQEIALPLAISFVTFQKIAYLVDSYRYLAKGYNPVDYALFASFFPQLIAGPIVHHSEVIPQFRDETLWRPDYDNITRGSCLFSIGLFKKVVLADNFAVAANAGFSAQQALGVVDAWVTSLSYTFQLYFDFSGYVDMALGSALLFNILLPINFNSPYKSLSIQDFWRRWHITLSRFLRDYLYIPLGGSRGASWQIYSNLMVTFLMGGLWHGASWMFVMWGALHGAALVAHRLWQGAGYRMPRMLAWGLLFMFVNVAWVFFRAEDMASAMNVLQGMAGSRAADRSMGLEPWNIYLPIAGLLICLAIPNSLQLVGLYWTRHWFVGSCGAAFAAALLLMASTNTRPSEFLYFNF